MPSDVYVETLEQRLARGALAPEEIVRFASDIAVALQEIHRDGLAYSRLEPATIILGPGGVKFERVPASGGKIVPYTAPEQVAGKPADSRSDIFAFGAILYEMSTGHRCFEGEGPEAWKAAILTREPPPIVAAGPGASDTGALVRALNLIVRDCLVKDPDRRRQRIHSVLLDLKLIALPSRRAERSVPRSSGPSAPSRESEVAVPPPEVVAAPDPPRAEEPVPGGTAAAVSPLFSAPGPEEPRAGDTEDEDEEKTREKRLSCPNCGWFDIRLSASRGVLDDILGMFFLIPFRCRTCSARFYRFRRHMRLSRLSFRDYGNSDPEDVIR